MKKRKLLLVSCLAPGDTVVMTAAIRDLHKNYPGKFITDVHTTAMDIWENNPYITKLRWEIAPLTKKLKKNEHRIKEHNFKIIKHDPKIEIIECNYNGKYPASINNSNHNGLHFLHAYIQDLNSKLDTQIHLTEFKGDIHISDEEKSWISQLEELKVNKKFWILMAGGKFDFTTKWWNPYRYQEIVDAFLGKILFVQCGETHHFHPKLKNVINLIGKTDTRQFIRLMYHSDGVLCPITFAMHLAAATESKYNFNRPCVVIAGGRESTQWEAYPHHQYITKCGALSCCQEGGCWRTRCQQVGDGDPSDEPENLCLQPVNINKALSIPKCMDIISTEEVISRIKSYYEGGILQYNE